MKITLSKALKEKKRLATKITAINTKISENCSKETSAPDFDYNFDELVKERTELVDNMTALKMAIYNANKGMMGMFFTIGEMKSEISIYRKLDTRDGTIRVKPDRYSGGEHYDAIFESKLSNLERNSHVENLEKKIDELQDSIDEFNATTRIEVKL